MRTDLLERYAASLAEDRQRRASSARAKLFLKWLGNREPSAQTVRTWLKRLRKDDYADGTIATDFAIIRRLFIVNELPWPFRKGEGPIVREQSVYAPALALEDIKAMVDTVLGRIPYEGPLKPHQPQVAFLALATVYGLRRIEIQEMEPGFLDVKHRLLFVQTAKKGRQRWHQVPDSIMPHLEEWGFRARYCESMLSDLFTELKVSIGLLPPQGYDLGWHAIRRSAVKAAWNAGLTELEIHSFYRWKRSSTNMALRYGTSTVVGRFTKEASLGVEDREVDEHFFAVHPFPKFWE